MAHVLPRSLGRALVPGGPAADGLQARYTAAICARSKWCWAEASPLASSGIVLLFRAMPRSGVLPGFGGDF